MCYKTVKLFKEIDKSEKWIDGLHEEYKYTELKVKKLDDFIHGVTKFYTLCDADQELLKAHYSIMRAYREILKLRLDRALSMQALESLK